MATATVRPPDPAAATIVLELNTAEALYVYAALRFAMPARDDAAPGGGDPVWDAVGDALDAAGVGRHGDGGDYARRN